MYTDIHAQFFQEVIETFNEYVTIKDQTVARNSKDILVGMNAAISLYHFGEYYADYFDKDFKKDVRSHLIKICPDYLILEGVANVRKHSRIDRKNPQILSQKDIAELRIVTFFEDSIGQYKNVEKSIELSLVDGSKRELYDVLVSVMNMWYEILYKDGIVSIQRNYSFDRNKKILRSEAKNVDIECTIEGAFSFKVEFRKYDYETGTIDEFIGDKHLNLDVKNNATGELFRAEVFLNNHEHVHFKKLRSEFERQLYLNSIVEKKGFKTKT